MSLPYSTATSGDRALVELQRTLAKFGCQSFGTMIDAEKGETVVQFKWRDRVVSLRASWAGYAAALMKDAPRMNKHKATEQAKTSVCSVLRDWTKGQITAVECGMMSFEAAFMPHILLPTGERVLDRIQSDKLLPQPEKVVELKR